jgi:HSP20 family protein
MLFRWNPFREVSTLQQDMNKLLEGFTSRLTPTETNAVWSPVVDIYEDEGNYVFKVELPGLTKEDIELSLENRTLTLRGERKMEKDVKEEDYHLIERSYGRFVRSFTLPTFVEQDKISADFKEGILEVVLPKAEEVKPKLIAIGAV